MKALKTAKIFRPLVTTSKKLVRFTTKNSNWILAILTILGIVGTAEEFTRATIKAVKLCEEKQPQGAKEIIKTVWKLYLPGVGLILVTTLTVCGNAKLNAKKLATVTGLYAASQADIMTIKEKAKEMLGEGKARKISDEVEREKLNRDPPPTEDFITKTGHGNQLFRMDLNGGYFRANPDYIDLKFAEFNQDMSEEVDGVLDANNLLERFDMPRCSLGNAFWDKYDMLEHGYKEVKAVLTTGQWMDVNGVKEMVSTVECEPRPSLL